jgi:hypothetical protein
VGRHGQRRLGSAGAIRDHQQQYEQTPEPKSRTVDGDARASRHRASAAERAWYDRRDELGMALDIDQTLFDRDGRGIRDFCRSGPGERHYLVSPELAAQTLETIDIVDARYDLEALADQFADLTLKTNLRWIFRH